MQLTVDRDVVRSLLKRAMGTVSDKDTTPILKNFLIKVEANKLRAMSTDMSLGAVAEVDLPSNAQFEEGMTCAPAKKLFDIVDNAPSGNVHFALESNELKIRGDYKDKENFRSEWLLHCMDAALYPEFPEFDVAQAVVVDREKLLEALSQVIFAAADTELRVNLMGVYINDNKVYAANGHVCSRKTFTNDLKDLFIPSSAVQLLVSLMRLSQAKEIKIQKTKFHILFQLGNDLYNCRQPEAKFPDVEARVLRDTDAYALDLKFKKRAELVSAIKRAAITTEDTNRLQLNFKNGKFSLYTINAVEDCFSETIPDVEWRGDDFTREINFQYLLDTLAVVKSEEVVIRLGEDKGNARSKYRIDDNDLTVVIMPLRVKTDETGKEQKMSKKVSERVASTEASANVESVAVN